MSMDEDKARVSEKHQNSEAMNEWRQKSILLDRLSSLDRLRARSVDTGLPPPYRYRLGSSSHGWHRQGRPRELEHPAARLDHD
jgi:hypothetical protein